MYSPAEQTEHGVQPESDGCCLKLTPTVHASDVVVVAIAASVVDPAAVLEP